MDAIRFIPYGEGAEALRPGSESYRECLCGRGPRTGILFVGSFPITSCAECAEEARKRVEAKAIEAREVGRQLVQEYFG